MAVITKEELMSGVQALLGENDSDEAIALLENMTDTLTDYETRLTPPELEEPGEDWEQKYNDLDKSWRERYIARFSGEQTDPEEVMSNQEEDVKKDGEPQTFEDLFKEREE